MDDIENLKDMTPDKIKELQKQNCIFCHIISGKVQSKKIYEDELTIAILDINPLNPGHLLVLPKEHYTLMPLMPVDEIRHIFMVVKALSHALLKALKVQGTNVFIANGVVAGQKAPHFMVHIIPRTDTDGVKVFDIKEKGIISEEEAVKLNGLIKEKLAEIKGGGAAVKEEIKSENEEHQGQGPVNNEASDENTDKEKKEGEDDGVDFDKLAEVLLKNE